MTEIEVLLDFGRPYVRLDDYNEMKERYWSQVTKTQDADGEAAKWQEHARAALARAEAAEAEAADAILVASDAAQREENAMHALSHFRARVAELEAALAAQQWRPVTEDWPPYGVQHLGRGMLNSPTLLVTRTTDDSDEVWQDSDGMLFYAREIRYCAAIPEARPLPPAPQETE